MLPPDPLMEALSDAAGENPDAVLLGELERDDGVGRLFLGDVAETGACRGGGRTETGSFLDGMVVLDLRECRFMMAR
jgi:hypothetical protein